MHRSPRRLWLRLEQLESRLVPFASPFLNSLGTGGFTMSGFEDNARVGSSVAGVGDMNGDGVDDVIVTAPGADAGGLNRGGAYVIFGGSNLAGLNVSLASPPGFTILGFENQAHAGGRITFGLDTFGASGAGDVNGDGFGDLIIGAGYTSAGGSLRGEAYVIFGRSDLAGTTVTLNSLGTGGFTLRGFENSGFAGLSVNGAGDVNGDGFADVIVGAQGTDAGGTNRGEAYVVFGGTNRAGTTVTLNSMGTGGFTLRGFEDNAAAGFSVSGAGDVSGDGFADLIVGAPYTDAGGTDRGAAYVVFGGASRAGTTVTLNNLGAGGFTLRGYQDNALAGSSVSGAGDVNGDGVGDVTIGAPNTDTSSIADRGEFYVVFGGPSRAGTTVTLNNLGSGGFAQTSDEAGDGYGRQVAVGGDLNGDGFAEVIVGFSTDTADDRGSAVIEFGDGNYIFLGGFEAGGRAGTSVRLAGDLNGDGLSDYVIGAPNNDAGGTDRGQAFVFFSPAGNFHAVGAGPGGQPLVKVYDAITGRLRHQFLAYEPSFTGGVQVAVGDLNGDSFPDIVTAPASNSPPTVRVFDGRTFAMIKEFNAYAVSFTGGLNVNIAQVNGIGKLDIITAPGQTGGPHVKVFNGDTVSTGADSELLFSFFAYASSFTGGVNMAVGDIDNDGKADMVTGTGPTGGPHVKVFSGLNSSLIYDFFAFEGTFTGGTVISAGDVNGDGRVDIIAAKGPGGTPTVRTFNGINSAQLREFLAYDAAFTGGVRVAAVDIDRDRIADIVTGAGPNGGPHVKVFKGGTYQEIRGFFAFDPSFLGGVYVGAGRTTN